MVKQVLPRASGGMTLVSPEDPAPESSLAHVGKRHTVTQLVEAMHGATGVLLIDAHSRPHCGILEVADGFAGMCGLSSGGAGGRCVDGTACYFGTAPRAVLQEMRAERVFFNGCTTAGVGGRRDDFLPRAAMVSHAVLRGAARELIGNVRSGHYDETDLDWFLAAAALGYTPAQSVEVLATARMSAGRETIRSALYFGDASNAAWPVEGVAVGEVASVKEGVLIRWPRADRVLAARVPGRTWSDLAGRDLLYAGTPHASPPRIEVIADPFDDASIVLAVPRRAGEPSPAEVVVGLSALPEPLDRSIGSTLAQAIEHVRWLEGLPVFAKLLANGSRQLEEELLMLRRATGARADVAMLPQRLAYARQAEDQAARRFDRLLIDEALARTRGYWNWQREYDARVNATPRRHRSSCPFCGAFANDVDAVDWASPRIERATKVCAYCGIVADLPAWPLRVRYVPEALASSATELTGRAEVSNDGVRTRRVSIGVAIERGGEVQANSIEKGEIVVGPGDTSSFAFSLVPARPVFEIFQLRLYVASEGAFGALSTFVRFGRQTTAGT
jgi:hypothetical protein